MDIKIKYLFLIFLTSGCHPSGEIDLYELKSLSDFEAAKSITEVFFNKLEDDNIKPYKQRQSCLIKKSDIDQIFVCIENNEIKVGSSLAMANLKIRRAKFTKLIDTLKMQFTEKGIKYQIDYKKNISIDEFRLFNLYVRD